MAQEKEATQLYTALIPPLISIIIPVYNQEDYLSTCLDSILEQSFQDFEIILVNDASTDYTANICSLYANKDKRIQVITNVNNQGQGYSRNIALKHTKAPYITYVDSDDYIEPALLKHGVELLENYSHLDIAIFNRQDINMQGQNTGWQSFDKKECSGLEVFEEFCLGNIPSYGPVCKVYRKSLLLDNPIEFPSYMWEDNLFTLKAYYYARQIVFTGEHGYTRVHAIHSASAMNPIKLTPRHISGICQLVGDIHSFFSSLKNEELNKYDEVFSRHFLEKFKTFFPFIITKLKKSISVVSEADLKALLDNPYFIQSIIDDFEDICQKRNQKIEKYTLASFQTTKDLVSFLQKYIYLILDIQKKPKDEEIENNHTIVNSNFDLIQAELKRITIENSLAQKLGTFLLENKPVITNFFLFPLKLYKKWAFLTAKTPPTKLGGKEFSMIINIYTQDGFTSVSNYLQNEGLPPYVLANAYTTLSKHTMSFDLKKSAEFAKLAYVADPQVFRLKWMTFRYYKAGDDLQASAMFDLLPKDIIFKGEEARIANTIKLHINRYKINRITQ